MPAGVEFVGADAHIGPPGERTGYGRRNRQTVFGPLV